MKIMLNLLQSFNGLFIIVCIINHFKLRYMIVGSQAMKRICADGREGDNLGKHFNPGNKAFSEIVNGNYIDKTGVIDLINERINTPDKLICVSRPRRFGKSFAAKMLCAYYDCTCDSHSLFDDRKIRESETYEEYLNKYNVISFDVTGFISTLKQSGDEVKLSCIPNMIAEDLKNDLVAVYPELAKYTRLEDCLLECVRITNREFVFIIDEWDALIREAKDDYKTQEAYLNLLRGLFKNNDVTPYVIAAAYMTGILPIKKDGLQSAISDFREYSILDARCFDQYTGFTEDEVKAICNCHNMDFSEARKWYDGYTVGRIKSIYNPYSLMEAMDAGRYRSYWKYTSAADSLETYINMNYEGLQEDVIRLISGESLEVNSFDFANDLKSFKSKDDVLTLMIHLGYLTYDEETELVRIPNEEVRTEFTKLLGNHNASGMAELIKASEQLLNDTLSGNTAAVIYAIRQIRESNYAPRFYNNEQALRYVIKFAYIVCVDRYMKVEELPSGKGIADVVFIPKRNSIDPAMVVELKWNKTSDAAISQIRDRNYPAVLAGFDGEIVLVGINYNDKTKEHTCKIDRICQT